MGRAKEFTERKIIGFDAVTLAAIDAYRREQSPIPNVSEAIRAILTDWLIGHSYLPLEPTEDDNQ